MQRKNLSTEEYTHLSSILNGKFETEIRNEKYIVKTLGDLPSLGISLNREKTVEHVKAHLWEDIKPNEIFFYSRTKIEEVYSLLKHFRNCGSHKNRIHKIRKDGVEYYKFEDKSSYGSSMRGFIAVDIFEDFIEQLYSEATKN